METTQPSPRRRANLDGGRRKELSPWITHLSICSYPPKPHTIKEMAEAIRIRRTLGINDASITLVQYDEIGEKWVTRFLERHSELASIMPEQIDAARVKESSHEAFQKWFADVKSINSMYTYTNVPQILSLTYSFMFGVRATRIY